MTTSNWQETFRTVFDNGIAAWKVGRKSPETMFDQQAVGFLQSIGCTAQEIFDFVDDNQRYGEPDFATTLAVTALRRDYYLNVLHGKSTGHIASMSDLPAKTDAVDGIAWLPRLIVKARLKLRGEMPSELMYGCAGDRPFLREMKMDLPSFLKLVWDSGSDDRRIIETVKKCAGRA